MLYTNIRIVFCPSAGRIEMFSHGVKISPNISSDFVALAWRDTPPALDYPVIGTRNFSTTYCNSSPVSTSVADLERKELIVDDEGSPDNRHVNESPITLNS